jgi:hypothetical protein
MSKHVRIQVPESESDGSPNLSSPHHPMLTRTLGHLPVKCCSSGSRTLSPMVFTAIILFSSKCQVVGEERSNVPAIGHASGACRRTWYLHLRTAGSGSPAGLGSVCRGHSHETFIAACMRASRTHGMATSTCPLSSHFRLACGVR